MIQTSEIVSNFDTMIAMEFQSIKNQKLLIEMYSKIHFNLGRIVVNEARLSIEQSRESIKAIMLLKSKQLQSI